jgi:hypothetical protein
MQLYPRYDAGGDEDGTNDEVTNPRVRILREQLAEHVRMSTCFAAGAMVGASSANHYLGSTAARNSPVMRTLHDLLKASRYSEFRDQLGRAELFGDISEFHGLNFRAILAVLEGSEHAADYLDMAEAAARSPYERAVVAENRAARDLLCGNPMEAAERCLTTLDHICQTEGLWNNLIVALYRLGEVETVDATLRSFMQLNPECSKRLVGLLSSEPDLQEVRARPAFKELVRSRATG